jgi:hypothetical protein
VPSEVALDALTGKALRVEQVGRAAIAHAG